jgi:hypothetical protein
MTVLYTSEMSSVLMLFSTMVLNYFVEIALQYIQNLSPVSLLSTRKIPVQEPKQKHVVLTLKQKMRMYRKLEKSEYCIYIRTFLMQRADLCDWPTTFPVHAR